MGSTHANADGKTMTETDVPSVPDSNLPAGLPPYPGPYGTDPATGQPRTEPEVTGQVADTPGNDENADGLKAGQATADSHGDVLGI